MHLLDRRFTIEAGGCPFARPRCRNVSAYFTEDGRHFNLNLHLKLELLLDTYIACMPLKKRDKQLLQLYCTGNYSSYITAGTWQKTKSHREKCHEMAI